MEEDLVNHAAKKTKEESGSVLLTYFQGDINSMVDEHFSRALSQAAKPKVECFRIKKNQKYSSTGGLGSSQWEAQSHSMFQPMFPAEHLRQGACSRSPSNHHASQIHAYDSVRWSMDTRQGLSLPPPPMIYPPAMPCDGQTVPEDQFSNSLLSMLRSDHPDTVVQPSSTAEFVSVLTKHPGFGEQLTP
ncbi:hypothetical protein DNTS_002627, partial [Danionella cerebrum]